MRSLQHLREARLDRSRGPPAQRVDQSRIAIARLNTDRCIDERFDLGVVAFEPRKRAGHLDEAGQLPRTDIDSTTVGYLFDDEKHGVDAVINVDEVARLLAGAPDDQRIL